MAGGVRCGPRGHGAVRRVVFDACSGNTLAVQSVQPTIRRHLSKMTPKFNGVAFNIVLRQQRGLIEASPGDARGSTQHATAKGTAYNNWPVSK